MGSYISQPLKDPVKLHCSYCNQNRIVERTDDPECPWCNSIMAHSQNCVRCYRKFWVWPDQHATRCKTCRSYRICLTCDQETTNSLCNYCTAYPHTCACCTQVIQASPMRLYGRVYCKICGINVQNIIKDEPVSSEKDLIVTYDRNWRTHDGYCSEVDQDEVEEGTEEIKRYFPLLTENTLSLGSYTLPPEGCGSGYCHCGVTYTPIETDIIDR